MKLNTMKSNFLEHHATLASFSGMFFWWAILVLYLSNRWEGIGVYVIGLVPALCLCLVVGWSVDWWHIIKSWRKRATLGWGLNILAQIVWLSGTKGAAKSRGIEFGTDGPFAIGAMAVAWVNTAVLLIVLVNRRSNGKKDNA